MRSMRPLPVVSAASVPMPASNWPSALTATPADVSHFAKGAIAIVVKQKIRHVIVRDENVLPAVVVVIEGHHSQAVSAFRSHSRGLADVGESAVAVVVIERRGLAVEIVGMAIAPHARARGRHNRSCAPATSRRSWQ